MSSDGVAISIEGLGKCYEIYGRPQDRLKQTLWRGRRQFFHEFWALRDLTCEVRRGETLGIIGRNGSGKSTLLQLICGILSPTEGRVATHGRVGALLEIGAGFNNELTGRENIHINAAVMGLTPAQIRERYAAIVSFADIGEFVEQPLKTYSSGMRLRLGFAVAVHVDPDILVIDEALAVGDDLFQFKCFLKFQEFQQMGKTIILVSHSLNMIKRYCSRALVLEAGRVELDGSPNDAVNLYTRLLFPAGKPAPAKLSKGADAIDTVDAPQAPEMQHIETSSREYRYGSGEGEIASLALFNAEREPSTVFQSGERMTVTFRAVARQSLQRPVLAMTIRDTRGQDVYLTNTLYRGVPVPPLEAGDLVEVTFEQNLHLIANTYFVSVGFVDMRDGSIVPLDRRYDVVEVKVLAGLADRSEGIANLDSRIVVHAHRAGGSTE